MYREVDFLAQQERYKEMLREAETERMLKQALPPRQSWLVRLLARRRRRPQPQRPITEPADAVAG